MPPQLETFVAGIKSEYYSEIIGTGFVVDDRIIVTCAHVIRDVFAKRILGDEFEHMREPQIGDVIKVTFPQVTIDNYPTTLKYYVRNNDLDLAILQATQALPKGIEPAILCSPSEISTPVEFSTIGYRFLGKDRKGLPATGKFVGKPLYSKGPSLILESTQIGPGMSGAPLYIPTVQRVVGMIARDWDTKSWQDRDTAFAYSIELIQTVRRELRFQSPDAVKRPDELQTKLLAYVKRFVTKLNRTDDPDDKIPLTKILTRIDAPRQAQDVKSSTDDDIVKIFDEYQELLILGKPGSGKSFTLSELARSLIERAERSVDAPIPVYLHLVSWRKGFSLERWIIETIAELSTLGKTDQSRIEDWLRDKKLFLLLDGLDEVSAAERMACIDAINEFRLAYGWAGAAICCQIIEYEEIIQKGNILKFLTPIYIKSLQLEQIDQYLAELGTHTEHLRKFVKTEPNFLEMAERPITLRLMSEAYQEVTEQEVEKIRQFTDFNAHKDHLLYSYVQVMFNRHEPSENEHYGIRKKSDLFKQPSTTYRLRWLAKQMQKNGRKIFFIEKLQPIWLPPRLHLIYLLTSRLAAGLILAIIAAWGLGVTEFTDYPVIGLIGGGIASIFDLVRFRENKLERELTSWERVLNIFVVTTCVGAGLGLFFGLSRHDPSGDMMGIFAGSGLRLSFFGLFFGMIFGGSSKSQSLRTDIQNISNFGFSPKKFLQGCWVFGGVFTLIVFIIVYVILLSDPKTSSVQWLTRSGRQTFEPLGIYQRIGPQWSGLAFGILFGLVFGGVTGGLFIGMEAVTTTDDENRSFLHIFWKNLQVAVFFSALIALCCGLLYWSLWKKWELVLRGVSVGFTIGATAFLWYGGYDFIKHIILRLILYTEDYALLTDYSRFLTYCCSLMFLEKSSGYQFIHSFVSEHFAKTEPLPSGSIRSKWLKIGAVVVSGLLIVWGINLSLKQYYPALVWRLHDLHQTPNAKKYRQRIVSAQRQAVRDDAYYSPLDVAMDQPVSTIHVNAGDSVFVQAGGKLSTGPFIVRIDPDGTEAGFFGFDLGDEYDLVPDFPNGALMCRIVDSQNQPRPISDSLGKPKLCSNSEDDKTTWCLCGSHQEFTSPADGQLEFEINDKEPEKHSGEFYVTIQVAQKN